MIEKTDADRVENTIQGIMNLVRAQIYAWNDRRGNVPVPASLVNDLITSANTTYLIELNKVLFNK